MTIQVTRPFKFDGVWRNPPEVLSNLPPAFEASVIASGAAKQLGAGVQVYQNANSNVLQGLGGKLFPTRFTTIPRCIELGNSYGEYDRSISGNLINKSTAGQWHWLLAMVGDHRYNMVAYKGIAGQTSAQILDRYPTDVAAIPHDLLFMADCAFNDIFGDPATYVPAESILSNVLSICRAENDAGVPVFLSTGAIANSSRANFSVARQKEMLKFNELLKTATLSMPGVILCSLGSVVRDSNDVTNYAEAALMLDSADHAHLTQGGSYRFARHNFSRVDSLMPFIPRSFSQADGTSQSWSNSLFADGVGQMAGTAGTKGTGVSGGSVVPTGWSVSGTASTTVDCQKVASNDGGGDWFEIKVSLATGVTTEQQVQFTSPSFHALVNSGDVLSAMFEIQVDNTGGSDITRDFARITAVVSAATYATLFNSALNANDVFQMDGVPVQAAPILHPLTLPGAPTSATVNFQFYTKNPTGGTTFAILRVRNVKPYKVVS